MKLMKSRKGLAFTATTVFAFGALALLLFVGGGIFKFILQDKTPLILFGIFILLIMFRQKRRGR